MITLLENEELLADLRRGALQRLAEDVLTLRTIILTNQRLILINKRVGSFDKKYAFLKDLAGIESMRSQRNGLVAFGALLAFWAVGLGLAGIEGDRLNVLAGLLVAGGAWVCFIKARMNVLRISTLAEDIIFGLDKSFSTGRVDEFVHRVLEAAARQKQVAQAS